MLDQALDGDTTEELAERVALGTLMPKHVEALRAEANAQVVRKALGAAISKRCLAIEALKKEAEQKLAMCRAMTYIKGTGIWRNWNKMAEDKREGLIAEIGRLRAVKALVDPVAKRVAETISKATQWTAEQRAHYAATGSKRADAPGPTPHPTFAFLEARIAKLELENREMRRVVRRLARVACNPKSAAQERNMRDRYFPIAPIVAGSATWDEREEEADPLERPAWLDVDLSVVDEEQDVR